MQYNIWPNEKINGLYGNSYIILIRDDCYNYIILIIVTIYNYYSIILIDKISILQHIYKL